MLFATLRHSRAVYREADDQVLCRNSGGRLKKVIKKKLTHRETRRCRQARARRQHEEGSHTERSMRETQSLSQAKASPSHASRVKPNPAQVKSPKPRRYPDGLDLERAMSFRKDLRQGRASTSMPVSLSEATDKQRRHLGRREKNKRTRRFIASAWFCEKQNMMEEDVDRR